MVGEEVIYLQVEINVWCFILVKFRFIKNVGRFLRTVVASFWLVPWAGWFHPLTSWGPRSKVHLEYYVTTINHVKILFTYV